MNVREIIEDYLQANGYTGLVNQEIPCGCLVDDLAPCGGECMNLEDCDAGYVHYCDECPKEVQDECTVEDCPSIGGFCVSAEKELKPREPDPPPAPWIKDVKLHDKIQWQVEGGLVSGTVMCLYGDCFGVVPDGSTAMRTITFDMFRGFVEQP